MIVVRYSSWGVGMAVIRYCFVWMGVLRSLKQAGLGEHLFDVAGCICQTLNFKIAAGDSGGILRKG